MSFYQNVFLTEFRGSLVLGDRQYSPNFKIPPNSGRGNDLVNSYTDLPYFNLSTNDANGNPRNILTIGYAIDFVAGFKNWAYITINVSTGSLSESAVTIYEIANVLNATPNFSDKFTTNIINFNKSNNPRLEIIQKYQSDKMKFYIVNGGAEEALKFNARAGVAEIPTYFDRHSIVNRFTFPDSLGLLIKLNAGSSNVDNNIIDNATDVFGNSLNLDHSTVLPDWQLLNGVSGIFTFKKQTVDGSDRVTSVIDYPAGAKVGDFARVTSYTYSGSQTTPLTIAEIPYTLTSDDLISP